MQGKRVLVIEDDVDVRAAISEILLAHGYSVGEASDGGEGLRRAGEDDPDLILLDLNMPRMDGWAFRKAQQADPRLAHIPVIVVSACSFEQAHSAYAAAYLQKPFRLDALLDVVARLCSGRGAPRIGGRKRSTTSMVG